MFEFSKNLKNKSKNEKSKQNELLYKGLNN